MPLPLSTGLTAASGLDTVGDLRQDLRVEGTMMSSRSRKKLGRLEAISCHCWAKEPYIMHCVKFTGELMMTTWNRNHWWCHDTDLQRERWRNNLLHQKPKFLRA